MIRQLQPSRRQALLRLLTAFIDQRRAAVIVPANEPRPGFWSIDVISGSSPDRLDPRTLRPVLTSFDRPESLHVKDPVVFDLPDGLIATWPQSQHMDLSRWSHIRCR